MFYVLVPAVSPPGAPNSGAEVTAVQTLRDGLAPVNFAERMDCGAFTAALGFGLVEQS